MKTNTTTQYILNEDALDVRLKLQDNSMDLILTDPPYFNVLTKKEHGLDASWDTQWRTERDFLDWIERYIVEFRRVLKPNGHLFLFTSTWQNSNIHSILAKHELDVLNNIIWFKDSHAKACGVSSKASLPSLKKYLTQREHVLYAGNYAKYKKDKAISSIDHQFDIMKREALRPIIEHFIKAAEANGHTSNSLNALMQNTMAKHYFKYSQFSIPSLQNFTILASALPELLVNYKSGALFCSVEEAHAFYKNEYKNLLAKADMLRDSQGSRYRHFSAQKDAFYSDVWTYSIPRSKNRHVCEKPLDMMIDIIKTTTREEAYVLDAFAGSGVVGEACARMNRNFIGIEKQEVWASRGNKRIRAVSNVL